jgi:hypothetical protein
MELTVKSYRHAKAIADTLARYSPLAANNYMDKFELRQRIEAAARDALYTV